MRRNMFSMQQKLFILFIYQQQFLCHAIWATKTATRRTTMISADATSTTYPALLSATFMPLRNATIARTTSTATETETEIETATPISTSPPPPQATTPLVVVSSSEATLLTRNLYPTVLKPLRMQWHQYLSASLKSKNNNYIATEDTPDGSNEISHTNSPNTGTFSSSETSDSNESNANAKNRFKIVGLHTNCSRDLFEMNIDLNRGFSGLLYAKDFPLECRARGSSHTNITLRLPTSGCGVRSELRPDGNMELSVRIMLQMEQKLRQSSDILKTVRCKLPLNAMGLTVTSKENNKQRQSNYRNGRTRNFDGNKRKNKSNENEENFQSATTPLTPPSTHTPRVRIWLELGDKDGSGAVEVGQETILTVRAIVPGKMGVRVIDCAAFDGLGESTQQLLENGCPIDEQVMPALRTLFKPAEEGWSKQNEDDLVEKTFTATFPAFKFPDRERLHVSCGVQLCKGSCPDINCRTTELSQNAQLSPDKHLARIEVFNSLAVTAPQIEVDQLRYDRRFNMSVEEYPPFVRQLPTEGTLCMSVSKLAISFCVLGIIFLVAVIVAICSLIRSRRKSPFNDSSALTSNASRIHRAEVCTSMFSSSSGDSTHTARFGSKLFTPYYPTATLPYGRVY